MSKRLLSGLQCVYLITSSSLTLVSGRVGTEPWSQVAPGVILGASAAWPEASALLSCQVVTVPAPCRSSAFVHRCGRTARIGHGGSALVFLLPMEESYISFLAINQKVSSLPFFCGIPKARVVGKVLFQKVVQNVDWGRAGGVSVGTCL